MEIFSLKGNYINRQMGTFEREISLSQSTNRGENISLEYKKNAPQAGAFFLIKMEGKVIERTIIFFSCTSETRFGDEENEF